MFKYFLKKSLLENWKLMPDKLSNFFLRGIEHKKLYTVRVFVEKIIIIIILNKETRKLKKEVVVDTFIYKIKLFLPSHS